MARKKFQLVGTPKTRGGYTVSELAGKEFVFVEQSNVLADGTPRLDSDREAYVYTEPTGGYGVYVLGANLAPVDATPKMTKADFPEGRLVLVAEAPATADGGYVDPRFSGAVARVGATRSYGDNVKVHDLDGTGYNVIAPEYLTLLAEGLDLASAVARPELAFEDAIRKAAEHRDAVEGKSSTDALIELAKLLVEVAK